MKEELLCDNPWVQLKRISEPPLVGGYVFSHEIRCNGKIVAFLPFRRAGLTKEWLFRVEATPCWEWTKPVRSSFTGGIDPKDANLGAAYTVVKELKEESGYVVEEKDLIYLGTSYGTKSSDSIYSLYTVDLTDKEPETSLHVESELEKTSGIEWASVYYRSNAMDYLMDPFAAQIILRTALL